MSKELGEIEFWVAKEWTMVYHNGLLVRAGDSYLADEWLQELAGVKVVQDDASVCIPDGHNALRTLAEAEAAMEDHRENVQVAENMRVKARRLLADADALEAKR